MKRSICAIGGIVAAAVVATTAMGDGHADKATLAAVKARQSQMTLYAFNISVLGGMAKGDVAYDAEAASAAASNLAALAQMDQSRMWPQGSDNEALGPETTSALPAIWQPGSTAAEKGMALAEAAIAMEQSAGAGLDALRGAIGAVGKSCGSCHESYRQKN
ncbi:c-type cytochrome [Sulfitobacter mediterraneus]|uniref:c-type cytochrome n=1 Tax=Sulfitobacter mediterraneus TaxID=83219 RepID=UPI0013C4EB2D|nr:cytochrome c [Sulfitobacter mediterraneus]